MATRKKKAAPAPDAALRMPEGAVFTNNGEPIIRTRTYTFGYMAFEFGRGIDGKDHMSTDEMRQELAELGVTDPLGTEPWEVTLPNGRTVGYDPGNGAAAKKVARAKKAVVAESRPAKAAGPKKTAAKKAPAKKAAAAKKAPAKRGANLRSKKAAVKAISEVVEPTEVLSPKNSKGEVLTTAKPRSIAEKKRGIEERAAARKARAS